MDAPKSSAPAHTPKDPKTHLQRLKEKYHHESLSEDERLELYEAIVRLRCKLGL